MNIEERVREHLEGNARRLRSDDNLPEVIREGRRRQVRNRVGSVVGVAAALAVVISLGSSLVPSQPEGPPVATDPPVTPTTLPVPDTAAAEVVTSPDSAAGVVMAGPAGITILDTDGNQTHALSSDQLYEEISVAYPDQLGGLVFQHAVTPPPWPHGSLIHLPAGADRPSVLAEAPAEGTHVPVGPATSPEGEALFVYLSDQVGGLDSPPTVVVADIAARTFTPVADLGPSMEASVGGSLIALVDREDIQCPRLSLIRVDGTAVESNLPDCLPAAAGIAVGYHGSQLAVLSEDELEILDIAGGSPLELVTIPEAYMVTSGPGGWVVRTPGETRLIDASGQYSLPPVDNGWVVPFAHPFDLPQDGSALGSGSGEVPCVPTSVDGVTQEPPEPVAATRSQLLELASACDYASLAELALDHGTTTTFGGGDDPAALWVAEGRTGDDPLGVMVGLLSRPGAQTEDGMWVWPAAFAQPQSAYRGWRVGIASDGSWQFFVAGD